MVYFEEDEKIKLKNLESFFKLMLDQSIYDGILVYKKEITSSAKKVESFFLVSLVIFFIKRLLKTN